MGRPKKYYTEEERKAGATRRTMKWRAKHPKSYKMLQARAYAKRVALKKGPVLAEEVAGKCVREAVVIDTRKSTEILDDDIPWDDRVIGGDDPEDCRTAADKARDAGYQRAALKAPLAQKEEDPAQRVVVKGAEELRVEARLAELTTKRKDNDEQRTQYSGTGAGGRGMVKGGEGGGAAGDVTGGGRMSALFSETGGLQAVETGQEGEEGVRAGVQFSEGEL